MSNFNKTDKIIFVAMVVAEIITYALAIAFGKKYNKEKWPDGPPQMKVTQTQRDKYLQRRGSLLLAISVVLTVATYIIGMVVGKKIPESLDNALGFTTLVSLILPFLLLGISVAAKKIYTNKINKQDVRSFFDFILSHRECAEETSFKKLKFLTNWKRATDIYAVVFVICGVLASLLFGYYSIKDSDTSLSFCVMPMYYILQGLARIRFPEPAVLEDEEKYYLHKQDYNEIYFLAEKAAKKLGCRGEIVIQPFATCNALVRKEGNTIYIGIGVILLAIMTPEELYNVLLHEFSHIVNEQGDMKKVRDYYGWLYKGGNNHIFNQVTQKLYGFFDVVYAFNYDLYQYAATIQSEQAADNAMKVYGDANIAASALIKLKYSDLFDWEKGTYDTDCIYESTEPEKDLCKKEAEKFKSEIARNKDKWNKLIDVEILSRSATHPTLKMRLEALGVSNYNIVENTDNEEYIKETNNAVSYCGELLSEECADTYEADRKAAFIDSLEIVDEWKNAGEPVVAETYGDICSALRKLGRNIEADKLCQRAIEELPSPANCYAHFMRGCFLLHSYDDRGLEHIYEAVSNNSNYIDEGLHEIGRYCCLTGNEEELNSYREKAINFHQEQKDKYDETGILKKGDKLCEENLPDGMLDQMLSYVRSVDNGCIGKIFLVRKVITEDFFTSAVIVDFYSKTDDETINNIMHKIFSYLDTSSDWQFSLFLYDDVKDVKIENVKNSCIYTAEREGNI